MIIKQEISIERISNLLCCALEGGSNYWYEIVKFVKPREFTFNPAPNLNKDPDTFKHLSYPLNPGGALIIKSKEDEDQPARKLNLHSLERGLRLMAHSKEYSHHWRDFLGENEDAITGDVFLQFCLFGEVLYG